MKNLVFTTFLLFLLCSLVQAQVHCLTPTASQELHGNNIKTQIKNGGDLFWSEDGNAAFQAPFTNNLTPSTIFTTGLMMGGVDPAGNLKLAAQFYGSLSNSSDYSAGPIDATTGFPSNESCSQYDQIWTVRRYEIEAHLADFADNGVLDNPINAILSWPALGNPHFESIHGFELPENQGMAPFWDTNQDGIYRPEDGDYPLPSAVHPDVLPEQMTWCVFNDAGNIHTESHGDLIKAEVQLTTWAFNCADNDILNNTIFTNYKIINKSLETIDSFHVGLFTDFDLGCYTDDYIGSNPDNNSFFVYNSDEIDGDNNGTCAFGVNTYAENPPVQAVTILNKNLDYFLYHVNPSVGIPPFGQTDPQNVSEIYNYLTGSWRDGSPITEGGSGYMTGEPTTHAFSGNPLNPEEWSMLSENMSLWDYRVMSSTFVGSLMPGAIVNIDYAFSFHQETGGDNLSNLEKMYLDIPQLQVLYDNQFQDGCSLLSICQEDCVWAGDANADGIANHQDMLAMAVTLGEAGPQRIPPYNWSPASGTNWENELPQGIDFKHIDADGNGTISTLDFDITAGHYDLTTPDYVEVSDYPEGPELFLSPSGPTDIDAFNEGVAFLQVNFETTEEVYGLAFTLEYDPQYIAEVRVLNLDNWNYTTSRLGETDIVQTKTDGSSLLETGDFARLLINTVDEFDEPLPSAQTRFRFKNIKAVNSDGTILDIGGTDLEVTFVDVPVSTEETALEDFQIYPIPTEGILNIQSPHHIVNQLELTDVQGKMVYRENKLNIFEKQINVSHLPKGIYFLKLFSEDKSWVKKVVVE